MNRSTEDVFVYIYRNPNRLSIEKPHERSLRLDKYCEERGYPKNGVLNIAEPISRCGSEINWLVGNIIDRKTENGGNGLGCQKDTVSIDRKIGKTDAQYREESKKTVVDQRGFKAVEGNRRRPGTGCLHQISEHLWEGRYSRKNEEGKRIAKTVYGNTKEECEEKLAALVESMKAEKLAQNSPEKTRDMDMPLLAM